MCISGLMETEVKEAKRLVQVHFVLTSTSHFYVFTVGLPYTPSLFDLAMFTRWQPLDGSIIDILCGQFYRLQLQGNL